MVLAQRSDLHDTVLDGRYRVLATIGCGGSGTVLEAERLSDSKVVAIKALKANAVRHAGFAERMLVEAAACRTLRHPGIVRCTDQGTLH